MFNLKEAPEISIFDYIKGIKQDLKIQDSTLIVSLIYIDRLVDTANIHLTKFNIHQYNYIIQDYISQYITRN